jgi:GNAT superfamily N-acetyltransferase
MNTQREQALAYLRQRPMQHLVHLKYLHLYGDAIACQCVEHEQSTAVLLSHIPALTPWDAVQYPSANAILLPSASDEQAAEQLADAVMQQFASPLVFKFCEAFSKNALSKHFALEPTRTLISFTSPPDMQVQRDEAVVIADYITPELQPLFLDNGYSVEELARYAQTGLLTFALYADYQPVCVCMSYQNFDQVWEIGGLRTVESARRKGYARRLVQTALSTLLSQGRIPRYQVEAGNTASVALAESLGMQVCLTFEHYQAD